MSKAVQVFLEGWHHRSADLLSALGRRSFPVRPQGCECAKPTASRRSGLWSYLLLALATLAVWGQTIRFGFVWDDDYFIRDLPSVRSLRHIPEMFYRLDAQSTVPESFVLFRPIRTAHYALLHAITGTAMPQPWIYHLANVFWHGATAMMLFAVLTLLLPQLCNVPQASSPGGDAWARLWALFAALGFAVHPVASEVVCWAKSLDDILAAFFVLAALWQLLQHPPDTSRLWRALALFALALYSKESAVPFALVPLVVLRGIHRLPWKQCLARTTWFLGVAAIYVVHRHLVIGRTSQTAPISGSYLQTIVDMFPVVLKYLRLLLGIPPFFIDYTYMRGGCSVLSPQVLAGAVMLLALIAATVLAWRGRQTALFGFGLLWMGLFLLPVSNLLPMMQYMAERFLYLPLVGWLIVLSAAGMAMGQSRIRVWLGVLVVLLWAGVAWNRSWIWQDDLTLFVRSAQEGPPTARVQENAVAAILKLPNVQAVFSYDRKSNFLSYRNTADTAARQSALRTFESARHLFPEDPVILCCLGISLATCGQPEKGLPYLMRAAALRPDDLPYALNWARAALDAKDYAAAKTGLDKAAALAPDDTTVLQLRFKYCWLCKDYLGAHQAILRLQRVAPSDENARRLATVEEKLRAAGNSHSKTSGG